MGIYVHLHNATKDLHNMMDNYIVSARKYRPSTFDSVVGQKALTTTLKNAIATHKLAHAYLFCGPRGVGKTTCARIFAKTINCLSPTADGEACNECESCRAFNEQRSYNIHELDAASNNSVDDIRQLVEQVRIPPQVGKYKVYIIDEVHMLSQSAFNAFLKTLEEPPHYAIFILATTEKYKILPTILSRCQIYDFNRITVDDITGHLEYVAQKEGVNAEPEALHVIAVKADGGMRDALSIFDQTVSFTGGNVTYQHVIENLNVLDYEYYFQITDYLLKGKVCDTLLLFNEILNKGFDGNHFITGLASHFRDLLVSRDPATLILLEAGASIRQRYQQQATECPLDFLYKGMKLCNDCDLNYKNSKNKRLLVELTLIQLAQITTIGEETHGNQPDKTPVIRPITPTQAQSGVGNPQTVATTPQPQPTPAGQPTPVQTQQPVAVQPQQPVTVQQPVTTSALLQNAAQEEKKTPVIRKSKLGISIKQTAKTDSHPDINVQMVRETAEEPDMTFDEKTLNLYWQKFAGELPVEQKAIAIKMQNLHPTLLPDGVTFELVVDNELAAKDFTALGSDIQNFLRQHLKNKHVRMTVRVSQANERVIAVSKAERFQMLAQKNSALLQLKQEFNLEFY